MDIFSFSPTFLRIKFFKVSFRLIIRVSNGLDPDQDRRCVGPDLGPHCLHADRINTQLIYHQSECTSCFTVTLGWHDSRYQSLTALA